MVEAAAGTGPRVQRDRAMLELLYGAGLRASELVGLRTADVDLETQFLVCTGRGTSSGSSRSGTPRGGRSVGVPRSGRARGCVRGADRGVLFVNGGRRLDRRGCGEACGERPGRRSAAGSPTRSATRSPATSSRAAPTSGRPGPPRPRRHRDDRDLHAPADGGGAPDVPHVPPASVRMEPRQGPGKRRAGGAGAPP